MRSAQELFDELNEMDETVYRVVGLAEPDKLQRDLASQCASMLNVTLRPEMQLKKLGYLQSKVRNRTALNFAISSVV